MAKAMLHKWRISDDQCNCRTSAQTLEHILCECPKRKFMGTWKYFVVATRETTDWFESLDIQLSREIDTQTSSTATLQLSLLILHTCVHVSPCNYTYHFILIIVCTHYIIL